MSSKTLEALVGERQSIEDVLTRYESRIKNHSIMPIQLKTAEKYIADLSKYQGNLDSVHCRISQVLQSLKDEDDTPHKNKFWKLCDMIDTIFNDLQMIVAASQESSSAQVVASQSAIQLPKIQLQSFDGNFQDWIAFRDLFQTTIHSNESLSNIQKLTYLKSCLKGEAYRLIQDICLTEGNYTTAWDLLQERYENEREIVLTVLKKLFEQPQSNANPASLRGVVDTTKHCLRTLESLALPKNSRSDAMVIYLVLNKLDVLTRQLWEQRLTGTTIPKLHDLFEHIEQRARALAVSTEKPNAKSDTQRKVHAHFSATKAKCKCCSFIHPIYKCSKFLSMNTSDRHSLVKKANLCFNCLSDGHSNPNCQSLSRCKSCNNKHHTLLHKQESPKSESSSKAEVVLSHHTSATSYGMLATAVVNVFKNNGQQVPCRALLDGGSTCSFITESCLRRLGLPTKRSNAKIVGLSAVTTGRSSTSVTFCMTSHFKSKTNVDVEALVLEKVTDNLPTRSCDNANWDHLSELVLADPQFFRSSPVDILLGSDVSWDLLTGNKISGREGSPTAFSSALGWLVAGKVGNSNEVRVQFSHCSLDERLRAFWETESLPVAHTFSPEEIQCENHFEATHSVNDNGRFIVQLPRKSPCPQLGRSKEMAMRRFLSLERRLKTNPHSLAQYKDFMQEYLSLGHMSIVPKEEVEHPLHETFYIPHHFVTKAESTTTKFRVVFDASARSTTGVSLNDTMLIGPTLQDSLVDIITRFRIYPIAYTADIAKMYRQIEVSNKDKDLQRILWRDSPAEPIQEYRLNTVTYGTASAPYLAVKVLRKNAQIYKPHFPLGSEAALNNFYVDDCMGSCKDVQTAKLIQNELISLNARAGMSLRKWVSNSSELLANLPANLIETKVSKTISGDPTVKALGIYWNTAKDCFEFTLDMNSNSCKSKRNILSCISKLFDPLGWLSPVVIRAKIIMQELWKLKCGWDEEIPISMQTKWMNYKTDLQQINQISLPRCMIPVEPVKIELLGFCDASEKAYGAVVYLRVVLPERVHISIVQSKTRVAPVKQVSLPRLELCAAHLLAELLSTVRDSLRLNFTCIHAWSDSTVTLSWISSFPSRWKSYIANRVSKIQDILPAMQWSHVPGIENPADLCSRGLSATDLKEATLWWYGPVWMQDPTFNPQSKGGKIQFNDSALTEERKVVATFHATHDTAFIDRFSSFSHLLRVTAWVLRFFKNLKSKSRNGSPLSSTDIHDSLTRLIRIVQLNAFSEELIALKQKEQLSRKSNLLSLDPFVDDAEILRVGGRLRFSQLAYEQKFPILLPKQNQFTRMLIQYEHKKNQHAGSLLLQCLIRERYWVIKLRDEVRQIINKCVTCARHKAKLQKQFMSDLPKGRVTPSRPFYTCGVDYAGPFHIRPDAPRSRVQMKAYLCLFVCFSTRSFHLEVASSLSTDAFIAAFRRFVARRGRPKEVFSDCGRNFVGGSAELNKLKDLLMSQLHNDMVSKYLAEEGVTWRFNPPGAPHFGGLWEAGVKSAKYHLYRIVGPQKLTFEELTTTFSQIEACLNSRPLTSMSNDPGDFNALTSGHFLIGAPLLSIPDPSLEPVPVGKLSRWQLVQTLQQHFWKRWSSEYLSRLQQRPKWVTKEPSLKLNDLVIVKDENLPPMKWRMGRVDEVHPGSDGRVRVVTLRTAEGRIKRPIHKLCLLPIDDDASSEI